MSINSMAERIEHKRVVKYWKEKFEKRFGYDVTEDLWDVLDEMDDLAFQELYDTFIEDEYNNKMGRD